MNILLIHSADSKTSKSVQKWCKNKAGLKNIYQLSVVGLNVYEELSLEERKEVLDYIVSQTNKAIKLYGIEKVAFVLDDNLELYNQLVKRLSNLDLTIKYLVIS